MSELFHLPRALTSASREALSNIKLTVQDGSGNPAKLPQDLQGHVFIMALSGTAGSPKPTHPPNNAIPQQTIMPGADGQTAMFDSDGMVYRIDFHQVTGADGKSVDAAGEAHLTSNLLKPPAFFADKLTHSDPDYKDFKFLNIGIARFSILGICNQINTALVPLSFSPEHPPRLIATNDANRPYEIDPCALKIVAPTANINATDVQGKKVWHIMDAFPGVFEVMLGSAHPAATFSTKAGVSTGELYSVDSVKGLADLSHHDTKPTNPNGEDKLYLVRLSVFSDRPDQVQQWEVRHYNKEKGCDEPVEILQSTHMLGVTKNYLVIGDTAVKVDSSELIFPLLLEIFKRLISLIKPTGESREQAIKDIEEGMRVLLKLAEMMGLSHKKISAALAKTVRASRRDLFSEYFLLDAPIQAILSDLERLLAKKEKLGTFKTMFVAYSQHLENNKSNSPWARLKKWVDTFTQHTLSWLVDELIKSIRLEIVDRQNTDTPLYVIKRSDLEQNTKYVVAKRAIVKNGAFSHFLTDYEETQAGEISIVALMTDGEDPSEYVDRYDRSQIIKGKNVSDLSSLMPMGVDTNGLAVVKIQPEADEDSPEFCRKHELLFEAVKQQANYKEKKIYQSFRNDPLYVGLYAHRADMPILTDVYVMQGGGWPETLTEFIYDLYKNYSPKHRKMPVKELVEALTAGVPAVLTHAKVNRENANRPLEIAQTYEFKIEAVILSIQFVPRAGSQPTQGDAGYITCTVVQSDNLYSQSDRTPTQNTPANWSDNCEIWIFDAQQLAAGPKYKLSHPRLNFGFTLHSAWLEAIAPAPKRDYSFEQDYGERVEAFIDTYLKTDQSGSYKQHDRETLTAFFKKIGDAFDADRKQTS